MLDGACFVRRSNGRILKAHLINAHKGICSYESQPLRCRFVSHSSFMQIFSNQCIDSAMMQIPSKEWLAKKTAGWQVKTHLNINVPRDQALEIISREGMLLVLCSYIDNMPYVVAEAAVRHT